jgi:phosphopantetheine--protein transferase-like protein
MNIGMDVEVVDRFASAGDAALRALFTAEERVYCSGFSDSAARYAGTWCAKEATVKALWPWKRLEPRRIEVSRSEDGRPVVGVSGWNPAEHGVALRVSISHCKTVATGSVIAWGPPPRSLEREPSR